MSRADVRGAPGGRACVLLLEPRERYPHRAEDPWTIRRPVPIRAAARYEAEELDQCTDARSVLVAVPGVSDLEPVEPEPDEGELDEEEAEETPAES